MPTKTSLEYAASQAPAAGRDVAGAVRHDAVGGVPARGLAEAAFSRARAQQVRAFEDIRELYASGMKYINAQPLIEALGGVIARLRNQFIHEERLLQAIRHPKCAAHNQAHGRILNDLVALRDALRSAGIERVRLELRHAFDAYLIHEAACDAQWGNARIDAEASGAAGKSAPSRNTLRAVRASLAARSIAVASPAQWRPAPARAAGAQILVGEQA